MTRSQRGGEPGGARLLELARRELEDLLPQLSGHQRYRLRLVVNAMKIAAHELHGPAADATAAPVDVPGTVAALRDGRLDGRPELHTVLLRLNADRRSKLK